MQLLASNFKNIRVMSLHTGLAIGNVSSLMVDPRKLAVVAFGVRGNSFSNTTMFLRTMDVREAGQEGLIVDSQDELVEIQDVIQLKEIDQLNFHLIGLKAIDEKKHKLGIVHDYTLELSNMVVQQLVVRPRLLQSLRESELLIHRSQIVKLTNDTVIVKATHKEASDPIPSALRAYTNPFRKSTGQAAPEQIERKD